MVLLFLPGEVQSRFAELAWWLAKSGAKVDVVIGIRDAVKGGKGVACFIGPCSSILHLAFTST